MTTKITNEGGSICHYYNGQYHRDDGPAIIRWDGGFEYYVHGKRHREDGPALYFNNSAEEYWYFNDFLHRDDGPAITYTTQSKEWYHHGIRHRIGAPSYIENITGNIFRFEWWVNDVNITEEVNQWLSETGYDHPLTDMQQIEFAVKWS